MDITPLLLECVGVASMEPRTVDLRSANCASWPRSVDATSISKYRMRRLMDLASALERRALDMWMQHPDCSAACPVQTERPQTRSIWIEYRRHLRNSAGAQPRRGVEIAMALPRRLRAYQMGNPRRSPRSVYDAARSCKHQQLAQMRCPPRHRIVSANSIAGHASRPSRCAAKQNDCPQIASAGVGVDGRLCAECYYEL
jgi:hypothetical protein